MQGIGADRRKLIFNIIMPVVMFLLVLFDQITKTYFKNIFEFDGWTVTNVIDNFFYFTYTVNTGAAWSFLSGVTWAQTFFKVLTGVALALFFIFYVYACKKNYTFLRFALIFIIAGTLGNFIDRLAYNGVVDFIGFTFGSYNFPIFNLADSYMTIGIIMLIIHYLFLDKNALFRKNENNEVSN